MFDLLLGISVFTGLVMILTAIVLAVRSILIPGRDVTIVINDKRKLVSPVGGNLLNVLAQGGLYLASVCGGRGTCGECKVMIDEGGGAILPTERSLLGKRDVSEHVRLACQVVIKESMRITLPEEIVGVKRWESTVSVTRNVSTLVRELILELPAGETMDFRAGSYIQVECPPYEARFDDFVVERKYRDEWDRYNLWKYRAHSDKTVTRAYSMANYPDEKTIVMLNVRIAPPPPGSGPQVAPGIVSSWLFSLRHGDTVALSGPFGHFFAKQTDKEMVFIGGGAGMAPMRSHIFDQLLRLNSARRITFWYGARNKREIFYNKEFDKLQREYPNFNWHVALSDPKPGDDWAGYKGYIHKIVFDHYLRDHPDPEECEYYVCGPPMMNTAVITMLEDLGVEKSNIMLDDFGS